MYISYSHALSRRKHDINHLNILLLPLVNSMQSADNTIIQNSNENEVINLPHEGKFLLWKKQSLEGPPKEWGILSSWVCPRDQI